MIRKILKIISIMLLIVIISICLYLKFNSNKLILQPFGYSILKVESGSMKPIFQKGDFIIIKKQEKYEVGDIITYSENNQYLITHRIIEKYEDYVITKGDYNNIQDEKPVNINNIYGKVIYVINL